MFFPVQKNLTTARCNKLNAIRAELSAFQKVVWITSLSPDANYRWGFFNIGFQAGKTIS